MAAVMTTPDVLALARVQTATPEEYARWDALRQAAEAAVIAWLRWPLLETTTVEYHSGNGQQRLPLARLFVSDVSDVRVDPLGAWGQAPGGFADSTALQPGRDYALERRGPGGRAGVLVRLSTVSPRASAGIYPSDLYAGGYSWPRTATWPYGAGNVRVTYTSGFRPENVPGDIRLAITQATVIASQSAQTGGLVSGESLGDYSYSLAASLGRDAIFGDVRQLLAPYRDMAL